MKEGKTIDLKKRHKFNCPYCGKIQYATVSIAHTWGIADAGHGTCLECKGFMKLIYNYEEDTITAKVWEVGKGGEMSAMRKECVANDGDLPGMPRGSNREQRTGKEVKTD